MEGTGHLPNLIGVLTPLLLQSLAYGKRVSCGRRSLLAAGPSARRRTGNIALINSSSRRPDRQGGLASSFRPQECVHRGEKRGGLCAPSRHVRPGSAMQATVMLSSSGKCVFVNGCPTTLLGEIYKKEDVFCLRLKVDKWISQKAEVCHFGGEKNLSRPPSFDASQYGERHSVKYSQCFAQRRPIWSSVEVCSCI